MTTSPIPATMAAVRLDAPGLDGLTVEMIQTPQAHAGEALVEVHAAALTRDELEWWTSPTRSSGWPLATPCTR